ncbi:RHO1 GDP-GTP exchange protein 2 [Monosporozyma unispora]|nr:RHO1 GDP-GTP exchange protein 2 [Kazachstania unispora]
MDGLKLYQEIFGIERLPDTPNASNRSQYYGPIVDRIEDITGLEDLLNEDILNDYIGEDDDQGSVPDLIHTNDISPQPVQHNTVLNQKTSIKKVPDTQSLSSNDSTPMSSPKKTTSNSTLSKPVSSQLIPNKVRHDTLTSSNVNMRPQSPAHVENLYKQVPSIQKKTKSPPPPPSVTTTRSTQSSSGSSGNPANNSNRTPPLSASNKMKNGFIPKRKPSLPQLALAGLKKQTSFSSPSTTPNTASRKSPLQGFGLFGRSHSNDPQAEQSQSHHSHHHHHINNPFSATQSSTSVSNMTPNSSSSNAYQQFTTHNNGSTPTTSTGKSSFYSHLTSAHSSQTLNSFLNNSNSNNNNNNNNSHSSKVIGLGLKTRSSSASLTSKRYTSASGTSLQQFSNSSAISNNKHHHRRRSSFTPVTSSSSMTMSPSLMSKSSNNHHHHRHSHHSGHNSMKKPQVYPAMLSRVATRFKKIMPLGEYKKDGLIYRDAFTGQQAVDILCSIIRSNDRNVALLLGRALDAQKLFHDVVYEHRLRDSPFEVYEFTDNSRFIGSGNTGIVSINAHDPLMLLSQLNTNMNNDFHHQGSHSKVQGSNSRSSLLSQQTNSSSDTNMTNFMNTPATRLSSMTSSSSMNMSLMNQHNSQMMNQSAGKNQNVDPSTLHNVNGVFTLLGDCYSPTCSRDKLCYSISCPRRLEQQRRLNLKPNGGLKRNISVALDEEEEEKPSWTSSVSEEVWKDLPKKEIKRQEAIYEVFITEKNFIKSLEVTRDVFMKTLAETNIIPADIRKNFIKHVFAHINDIYSVNRRFLEALTERQKASPVVKEIGDIFLRFIPFFEPFVSYVASRPYAKYLIETQRSVNPHFARFDDDMMNSSLRHGIDSFLSQGVSRPGRYMLLVREIMKSSDEEKDKKDLESLTRAMEVLRDFMKRIDKASGTAQDRHDVKLLKQKILFKNEYVNMGLNDEKRKIKHEGVLSRKEMTKSDNSTVGDIQFYLLDNMLLFLKAKSVNKWHQHKVFQRPIPLPLLFACPAEDMPSLRRHIGSAPDTAGAVIKPEYNIANPKNAITFLYYGAKQKYQVTLYAAQLAGLQTLLDKIKQEQQRIITDTSVINVTKITDKFFDYANKINSVSTCDGGRKLLIATNLGLYISSIKRQENKETNKAYIIFSSPVQLVQRSNCIQVAVLDEFQCILVLIDKKLYSCPLALLNVDGNATSYFKKHAKELINHVNFFSEGDCNGKRLIVTAHSSSHSIKFFELEPPSFSGSGNPSKKSLKKKVTEVVFDSEPVSISFLKANLCIGCKKGFQIVSISQNAHESLLDPADTSLEFALRDTLKPMAIYRVGNMFLLCYTEFAFFVNNQGWRKKESHIIHWEGEPQKFAIWYPYILAFNTNFIEIRKIETGELVRCILGDKIRLLQTNTQEILYAYEDARGYDTVASLDFWG